MGGSEFSHLNTSRLRRGIKTPVKTCGGRISAAALDVFNVLGFFRGRARTEKKTKMRDLAQGTTLRTAEQTEERQRSWDKRCWNLFGAQVLGNKETSGSEFGWMKRSFVFFVFFSFGGGGLRPWRSSHWPGRTSAFCWQFIFFLFFFILLLQEEQSQRDIEKDESSINRFSAFVWQSVIRRRRGD